MYLQAKAPTVIIERVKCFLLLAQVPEATRAGGTGH